MDNNVQIGRFKNITISSMLSYCYLPLFWMSKLFIGVI